ncbi:MAG TPA: radical SAM protein, partial [Patescibacteria group bacterium]|nr:radical SAM protein [Patescibacteria group bacterium]
MKTLNVVLIKPSKYGRDEYVERFRRGYLPNATLQHILSMTPSNIEGVETKITAIDEYVHTDLEYLKLLRRNTEGQTLVALVGVQSHQFHRALDLAALAVDNGCLAVLGGPHVMTNNTSMLQGTGVSFALSEAENVWPTILNDAVRGELQPVYGAAQRWARKLPEIIVQPPLKSDLRRYLAPIVGLYPARGCPFTCSFCSVIKIAGRMVRSQSIEATIASLVAAKAAGVRFIIFCSDNFNKYSEVTQLLEAMISERLGLRFFCQCDVQISRQPELVELLARAGCFQIFVGVESFNRKTLLAAHKAQNHPEQYRTIAQLCRQHNIALHCS